MKKLSFVTLLSIAAMALVGCGDKKISQETFAAQLQDVKTHLTVNNDDITDVHINDTLSIEVYNYKEGEYSTYRYFAVALIIPISYGDYTWKEEDGRFYHYHDDIISSHDKWSEITEEQFNDYMAAGKQKLLDTMMVPVLLAEGLMNGGTETYSNAKCTFYQTYKKYFKLSATATYKTTDSSGQEVDANAKITLEFKDKLPTKFQTQKDGKSTWKYTYGDSTFTRPNPPSDPQ